MYLEVNISLKINIWESCIKNVRREIIELIDYKYIL